MKCIENSLENMHAHIRVKSMKTVFWLSPAQAKVKLLRRPIRTKGNIRWSQKGIDKVKHLIG